MDRLRPLIRHCAVFGKLPSDGTWEMMGSFRIERIETDSNGILAVTVGQDGWGVAAQNMKSFISPSEVFSIMAFIFPKTSRLLLLLTASPTPGRMTTGLFRSSKAIVRSL